MKTKLLTATLALTLALLASGCGGQKPSGTVVPLPSDAFSEDWSTVTPETQNPDETELFHSGAVEGGTYTNTMLGLGCTLDDAWTFASEDEIAAVFGMAKDLIDQAETGVDLDDGTTFTDLYVYADDGLVNMNIQIQKLGVLDSGTLASLSEDQLLDGVLETLEPTMESAYSGLGTISFDKTDATFLGQPHSVVSMVTSLYSGDTDMYQKQVYLLQGRYLATITCTSTGVDMTDDLLALFYAI